MISTLITTALLTLTSVLPILAEPDVLRSHPSNFTVSILLNNTALNNTLVKWAYGSGFDSAVVSSDPEPSPNDTFIGTSKYSHVTFNLQNGTLQSYYPNVGEPYAGPWLGKLDGDVLVQQPPRFPQPNITCSGDYQEYVCQQSSRFSYDPYPGGQAQFPSVGYGLGSVHAWTLQPAGDGNGEYNLMPSPTPPNADFGWFTCGGGGGTQGKGLTFAVWTPGHPNPDTQTSDCIFIDAMRVNFIK